MSISKNEYPTEYDAIVKTIQLYIDGSTQGRSEIMRPGDASGMTAAAVPVRTAGVHLTQRGNSNRIGVRCTLAAWYPSRRGA
jgi:hypothetical protein